VPEPAAGTLTNSPFDTITGSPVKSSSETPAETLVQTLEKFKASKEPSAEASSSESSSENSQNTAHIETTDTVSSVNKEQKKKVIIADDVESHDSEIPQETSPSSSDTIFTSSDFSPEPELSSQETSSTANNDFNQVLAQNDSELSPSDSSFLSLGGDPASGFSRPLAPTIFSLVNPPSTTVSAVPEPGSLTMSALGLLGLLLTRRR